MAWLPPEDKLDIQQREFLETVDIDARNLWIKGFPGSGKSVLLAYTLRRIKNEKPNADVAVVVFTHSLIAMFKAAFVEMGYSANIMTYFEFMDKKSNYDYVLSDEIQDMTGRVLSTMMSRAKHVIVAGDENQSIYECDPRYREATVTPTQIYSLLDCRSFELNIIHRLSSSIIAAVEKFMPNLNIFASTRDMNKVNTQIRLCTANSNEEEVKYIMNEAQKAVNVKSTAAVLLPTQQKVLDFFQMVLVTMGLKEWSVQLNRFGKVDYNKLNSYLKNNGLKLQYVGNGYGTFVESEGIICVMTYHSSKGLDFDNVFLPGLNQSLYINSNEHMSRTLFMVAMTRSRLNLYLLHSGSKSAYLSNFMSDCNRINVHDILNGQNTKLGGNNIFGI